MLKDYEKEKFGQSLYKNEKQMLQHIKHCIIIMCKVSVNSCDYAGYLVVFTTIKDHIIL